MSLRKHDDPIEVSKIQMWIFEISYISRTICSLSAAFTFISEASRKRLRARLSMCPRRWILKYWSPSRKSVRNRTPNSNSLGAVQRDHVERNSLANLYCRFEQEREEEIPVPSLELQDRQSLLKIPS
jgi:hypothetical protein